MRRFDMFVPENLKELLEFLDSHQSGVHLIANGTDLINRMQRREIIPKLLVDLSGLNEFKYVKSKEGVIRVGALTTISELAANQLMTPKYSVFKEVASKFGGPSIINMATVGGNICAASSSEDLIPVLLVLNAQVQVRSITGERTIPIEEFLSGKRTTQLRPNEILVETRFPDLEVTSTCSFEKVGMRNSLITAFVNCAVYLHMDGSAKVIDDVRIAFNRTSGKIPQRARETETALKGKTLNEQTMTEATRALRGELKLTSDFRVSEEYRTEVACAVLKRTLLSCAHKLLGEEIVV